MKNPLLVRRLNKCSENTEAAPIPNDMVEYASSVLSGLHKALIRQTKPVYETPEQSVDGWGLTSTPIERRANLHGIPVVELLGHRALFLSTIQDRLLRVLYVPSRYELFDEKVLQIRQTTVPALLREDPTLYYGLMNAAEESIKEFDLDYVMPEPFIYDNI